MIRTIYQSVIQGSVFAPPSKSMTQRAIAAALLSEGTTVIKSPSRCNDSLAALGMAGALGAVIESGEDFIKLTGTVKSPRGITLNCGESGLAMRLFSPIAALLSGSCILSGEGSLRKRPVTMITDSLSGLGVVAKSSNGFLPLTIEGILKGGDIEIDGSAGSQMLTGLLMALPVVPDDSVVTVRNLKSKPYIDLTLQILDDFGIKIENKDYKRFFIHGNQSYKSHRYSVEGDWSGAAFMLVAGTVAGEVTVNNLKTGSLQADVAVLEALKRAGASIISENNAVKAVRSTLKAFDFDATESPDLFPPLACLAINCSGTSRIKGVTRLEHKESDRGLTILSVLNGLGIKATISDDIMLVEGGEVKGASVSSHNDHRIAMMAAVAALNGNGPVTVTEAEAVSKSYPEFFSDMEKIGADIR